MNAHGEPVPDAFLGVWQRTLLEVNGAEAEAGSQVYWLQTRHWHGDLRIPAGRPDFSCCRQLADCTAAQRRWLAGQKGFAGITQVTSGTHTDGRTAAFCQWHRQVDFQPTRSTRDFGRIVFHPGGETLDEFGVDSDYRETWVRLPHSVRATGAWRRGSGGASGTRQAADAPEGVGVLGSGKHPGFGELLLAAGSWFFYLRDRALPLPAVTHMESLAADPAAVRFLDMELSVGHWDADTQTGVVTRSTLPWCEGRRVRGGDVWVPD